VRAYLAFRSARPGLWLLAALTAALLTYTGEARADVAQSWMLLDLFLAYRIWRRGQISLRVFRFLQALGTAIFGIGVAAGLVHGDFDGLSSPWVVAPFAISLWCSFAPAISMHVFGPAAAPQSPIAFRSTSLESRLGP
jgi:hypothetical protein